MTEPVRARIFNRETPIEAYYLDARRVAVKREDEAMIGAGVTAPRLAKLRGVFDYINKTYTRERWPGGLAVFDSRISHAGWGVSIIAAQMGIPLTCYFPMLKDAHNYEHQQHYARDWGARLCPMTAGRTGMVYARAKKDAEAKERLMLPFGLTVNETLNAHKAIVRGLQDYGSIVLATGSGTITSGVLSGFNGPVIGISPGMSNEKQRRKIRALLAEDDCPDIDARMKRLTLHKDPRDYYTPESGLLVPFPCSKWYDRKAWRWLGKHIWTLEDPVLFYNIG